MISHKLRGFCAKVPQRRTTEAIAGLLLLGKDSGGSKILIQSVDVLESSNSLFDTRKIYIISVRWEEKEFDFSHASGKEKCAGVLKLISK